MTMNRTIRRALLASVLCLALVAGACGDDGGDGDDDPADDPGTTTVTTATTVTTPAPPTTAAPSTTAVPPAPPTTTVDAEAACLAGDQLACDTLSNRRLRQLCDGGRGSEDACQVLLAREGDGLPDGSDGESAVGGE